MDGSLSFLTAFSIGLLGSTHCVAMCGGIVGMLSVKSAAAKQGGEANRANQAGRRNALWLTHLTYNAGRITSYALIGAIAGTLGMGAARIDFAQGFPLAPLLAGGFMVALGLHLSGWWPALASLERVGGRIWQKIRPLGNRFLPADSPLKNFGLGLVWGWLPCGLVYSAVVLSLTTASPLQGALFMMVFGLGTLPMLLAMGGLADRLPGLTRLPIVRQVAGGMIILAGLYTAAVVATGNTHSQHGHRISSMPLPILIANRAI